MSNKKKSIRQIERDMVPWALEANGPANILLYVQSAKDGDLTAEEALGMVEYTAERTVRYLRAVQAALRINERPPYWHEVD